jgi:ribosomal protein L16 Arg81 hydroxylase
MHFDRQHVFFCQVEGAKNWTISRTVAMDRPPKNLSAVEAADPRVASGLRSHGLTVRPPQDCDLIELTLRQGDVLYLPPGTWHQARTTTEHSFHYTLSFEPFDFFKVLGPILRQWYLSHPQWRDELRLMGRPAAAEARLEILGRALTTLKEKLAPLSAQDALDAYNAVTGGARWGK